MFLASRLMNRLLGRSDTLPQAPRPGGYIDLSHLREQIRSYLLQRDWTEAYLDELVAFPEGEFSDQVDGSSGALNLLALMPAGGVQIGLPARRPATCSSCRRTRSGRCRRLHHDGVSAPAVSTPVTSGHAERRRHHQPQAGDRRGPGRGPRALRVRQVQAPAPTVLSDGQPTLGPPTWPR